MYLIIISFSPILLFMFRNILSTGHATDRQFIVHLITMEKINNALISLRKFTLPDLYAPDMRFVVLLLLTAMILFVILPARNYGLNHTTKNSKEENLVLACISFVFIYILVLMLSISYYDFNTNLNTRILFPIVVPILIIYIHKLRRFLDYISSKRLIYYVCIATCITYLFLVTLGAIGLIRINYKDSRGYASKVWKYSQTIKAVNLLGQDTYLVSNDPTAIYLHTGRRANNVPLKIDPVNFKKNEMYHSDLEILRNELKNNNGVVVFFYRTQTYKGQTWYRATPRELMNYLSLQVIKSLEDGVILKVRNKG